MKTFQFNLMKRSMIVVLLILNNACSQRESNEESNLEKKEKLEILGYGMPASDFDYDAKKAIAGKYGAAYKKVAGCIMPPGLQQTCKATNERTFKMLNIELGCNAEQKFNSEVDSLKKHMNKAFQILKVNKSYLDNLKKLKMNGYFVRYSITPSSQGTYSFDINLKSQIDTLDFLIGFNHFTYRVNTNSRSVLLQDSIRKVTFINNLR